MDRGQGIENQDAAGPGAAADNPGWWLVFPLLEYIHRPPESGRPRPDRAHDAFTTHGRDPMPRIPYRDLTQSDEMAEKLEMSTAEIGLSVRTTNCLEERGIFTVNDLLNCTRADLLSISNFGEKTLEEVYKALEKIGFFRATPLPGTTGGRDGQLSAATGPRGGSSSSAVLDRRPEQQIDKRQEQVANAS